MPRQTDHSNFASDSRVAGSSLAGSLDSSPGFATVCLRDLRKIISFFWTSHSSLVNKITGEDGLRFLGTLTFCDYR